MLNINWFKFELWNKILQRGREAERDTNDAKAMQAKFCTSSFLISSIISSVGIDC